MSAAREEVLLQRKAVMTSVSVYYEAPYEVIELNAEQEELWLAREAKLEEARQAGKDSSWAAARPLYNEADAIYEEFGESLLPSLSYDDLEIDEISQW